MKQSKADRALDASCYVLLGFLAVVVSAPGYAASPAPTASRAATSAAVAEQRDETPQRAVWVRRKINLVYLQSITHYSCYYLRDYVRQILLQLGARKEDLDVHPVDCGAGPPSVSGSFYALELASDAAAPGPSSVAGPVVAHWTRVDVSYNDPFERVLDVTAKCQLVQIVFDRVLPLFAVRNAHLAPKCSMYTHLTNAAILRAEVLKPDAHE